MRHIRHLVRDVLTDGHASGEVREGDLELLGAMVIGGSSAWPSSGYTV